MVEQDITRENRSTQGSGLGRFGQKTFARNDDLDMEEDE